MDNLIDRTEAVLLGALLTDPSRLDDARFLVSTDFHCSEHRVLYEAMVEVLGAHALDSSVRVHVDIFVAAANDPVITTEFLRGLAAGVGTADLELIPVYARLVQEASVRTMLASHTERLAELSATADSPERRHLSALAQALNAQAAPFTTASAVESAPEMLSTPGHESTIAVSGTDRERAILADLIQHPDEIREVRPWLTTEAFAHGPNREAYAAVTAVADRGEPVTDLTVSWELARRQTTLFSQQAPTVSADMRNLYRTIPVEPGAAIHFGRQLVADHVRAQLFDGAATSAPAVQRSEPTPEPAPLIEPQRGIQPSGPTAAH